MLSSQLRILKKDSVRGVEERYSAGSRSPSGRSLAVSTFLPSFLTGETDNEEVSRRSKYCIIVVGVGQDKAPSQVVCSTIAI